ncbi:MAG: iron uptake porin, partial [Microcystaceae cyanobacterium]
MLKMSWKSLLISPAILGTALVATSAQAAPDANGANTNSDKVLTQIDSYANEGQTNSVDQVTSVSELRDVQPTEWAYEALKSLVERYGCIVGYPDRTFRGNRALSRWEFAAGLNACMNVMERLIQENVAVLREDIDKLKRLMQE